MGEMRTAKLWFKVAIASADPNAPDSGEIVDAVIEVEVRADVYRAIVEGRASIRDFKVIGGE